MVVLKKLKKVKIEKGYIHILIAFSLLILYILNLRIIYWIIYIFLNFINKRIIFI